MYKPFHLIGLELNMSILAAALLGRPTGATRDFVGDAVASAKRDLAAEALDGEGGFTVYGKLLPARTSLDASHRTCPRSTTRHRRRNRGLSSTTPLEAVRVRRAMEARFGTERRNAAA